MSLMVQAVVEYNDEGYLVFSSNYIGAFVRGRTKQEALDKFAQEIPQYILWATGEAESTAERVEVRVAQECRSDLQISDADSEVLFSDERLPLTLEQYRQRKALAMKSGAHFQVLYDSIPDKQRTSLAPRKTFYGEIARTAAEMYAHTNKVTSYYFGEIGVAVDNLPDLVGNRQRAFRLLEARPDFLLSPVYDGSYGEQWSLRKVLRRLIWHDRIHAKAMYRMARKIWSRDELRNPFCFGE